MPTDSASLLADASQRLDRRDAELLLAATLGISRTQLMTRDSGAVPDDAATRFRQLAAERAAGTPLAYLLGRREFWSLDFHVSPAVLVPRPETEVLVERVLALVSEPEAVVADLGTGSGAIAVALAHERPRWRIVATDRSAAALEVARGNGARHAAGRIDWLEGDWFEPLDGRRFAAIASNPPYVAADDPHLDSDGLRHEPRGALTPGGDGYSALYTLVDGAARHLLAGGWLALEHGTSQGEPLRARLVARGFTHVRSHRDLAGHERVTEGCWPLL